MGIGSGLLLGFLWGFRIVAPDTLNLLILFYSIGLPLYFCFFDAMLDLNDKEVFRVWVLWAVFLLCISIAGWGRSEFLITRTLHSDAWLYLNSKLGQYATSSLKAPFAFLMVYWVLNRAMHRKGIYLVNTARLPNRYHEEARRKVSWGEVFLNQVLFWVILSAVLFGG